MDPEDYFTAIELLGYPDPKEIHPVEKHWRAVSRHLLLELKLAKAKIVELEARCTDLEHEVWEANTSN